MVQPSHLELGYLGLCLTVKTSDTENPSNYRQMIDTVYLPELRR